MKKMEGQRICGFLAIADLSLFVNFNLRVFTIYHGNSIEVNIFITSYNYSKNCYFNLRSSTFPILQGCFWK